MTKRTTTGVLMVIGALVAAACGDGVLPSEPDLNAELHRGRDRAPKVEVCHFRNNGKYKKIRVNERGAARHILRHARDESPQAGVCPPRTPKVEICHRGKVKMVREFTKKYFRHLDHGDALGDCDTPAPDPTISGASWTFTPLPPFFTTGLLNVTFSSSDCIGVDITYQMVGVQDQVVKSGTTGTGDGPFMLGALIPATDPNTEFQVRGLCDNGVALSAPFTK